MARTTYAPANEQTEIEDEFVSFTGAKYVRQAGAFLSRKLGDQRRALHHHQLQRQLRHRAEPLPSNLLLDVTQYHHREAPDRPGL